MSEKSIRSFIIIDVLEVKQIKQSFKQVPGSSVKQNVVYATCLIEGSTINCKVADGVDIPEGWAGTAVCTYRSQVIVSVYQNSGRSNTVFIPDLIVKFNPTHKVDKASQIDFSIFSNSK